MATIRRQYFNPKLPGSFSGISGFQKNRKFKRGAVEAELKSLPAYSLHSPARKSYPRRRVVIPFIDRQWVADLLDMQKFAKENRGYRYIVVIVEGLSRYLFTVPVKDKTGPSLVQAFKQVMRKNKRKPQFLQVDQGAEFLNKNFKKFLKESGIQIFHTFSKLKAVLAERMIRTLRTRIQRYFTHTGTNKYIDALPYFTSSYNATYHSSIKMAPRDVNERNELEVWLNLYSDLAEDMMSTTMKPRFRVGELVRISREKLVFEKGYNINWSVEVFKIKAVHDTRPVTYTLVDGNGEDISGGFLEPELQRVIAIPATQKVGPSQKTTAVPQKTKKKKPEKQPTRSSARLKKR